ncbi:MAG: sporulation protein YqfC [Clostridiales bacterium]|nr:sporulation protein YqfC [Clostridiales bacterium]
MLSQRLRRADIPQELVLGWPRSVLLGDEKLLIEQHQGIFACTQQEVVVKTLCGLLIVSGENLSVSRYSQDDLVVFGKIRSLSYRPAEGRA